MTWQEFLADGRAERHSASRQELDELRDVIRRNLDDASIHRVSADNRFGIAYEAALLLARIAVACAGYRMKGIGAHRATFDALELAMGPQAERAASYFDRCRRKRNMLSYETAGVATEAEAAELLREVRRFRTDVETWIAESHPSLTPRS